MTERQAGRLVAISGIDGSGKTTLCETVRRELARRTPVRVLAPMKLPCHLRTLALKLHFPDAGDERRREQFIADVISWTLRHNGEEVIGPALWSGQTVLADRWVADHVASQRLFGVTVDPSREPLAGLGAPDMHYLVTVPVELALRRIEQRDEARIAHEQDWEFLQLFQDELQAELPGARKLEGHLPVAQLAAEVLEDLGIVQ